MQNLLKNALPKLNNFRMNKENKKNRNFVT